MSLFSAIQVSSNALRVNQLGLQVVGNNISNANTPGYIRQELIQAPAQGYRVGDNIIGQGVLASGVRQQIDYFVADRLRETDSQLAYYQTLNEGLTQLQDAMNEMGENDFSSSLSRFSNSLQDIANNPQSTSIQALAVRRGVELTQSLRELSSRAQGVSDRATGSIAQATEEINRLSSSIAELNKRIVETEGGRLSQSDAVGLRDERQIRLTELAQIVSIQAVEQANGSTTVLVGGDFLVADGLNREVKVTLNSSNSLNASEVRFVETDAPLTVNGGKLRGYYEQRSGAVGNFVRNLDSFANNLVQTVNRIHSQGQGSIGYSEVVGDVSLSNLSGPLEQSAKNLVIDNGSFRINVKNESTNSTRSFVIDVRQLGNSNDTTVNQLVSQIDAVDGVSAFVGNDGRLRIESDSQAISFSFAEDSSGALAALGINTFFSGNTSTNISVRSELQADPRLLAISLDGPGSGARNALELTKAFTSSQRDLGGMSIQEAFESFVADSAQHINSQQTIAEGIQNFRNTLEARHLSITGVSLDEEATKLLMYQRAFQASARVISVANDLMETLVGII